MTELKRVLMKSPDERFTYVNRETGAEVYYRRLMPDEEDEIRQKSTARGVFNPSKFGRLALLRCVLGWSDHFQDLDGKPVPCNAKTIPYLPDDIQIDVGQCATRTLAGEQVNDPLGT